MFFNLRENQFRPFIKTIEKYWALRKKTIEESKFISNVLNLNPHPKKTKFSQSNSRV